MSTDEYVPSEEQMRHAYWLTRMLDHHADVDAAFDRFLARVRRDAAREALDGAEHRIARLEAQTSIRGRAVVYACERTREAEAERDRNLRNSREAKKRAIRAEARIKAVEDVLDAVDDGQSNDPVIRGMYPRMVNTAMIRRALDT